uniref:F-box protein AT5G49610-like beta-propeller domain-containing protein n=1 Tax=Aegilops tauschii TaxID=37682 RepID=M8BQ03_AEGTA
MLWEILLLLPPQPSSRLLASLVSRRWRGLATDPNFIRQFQARRRSWKPPLLGFFERRRKIVFNQDILHPPDRVPAERIHIPFGMASRGFEVLGCRGGRVLALHRVLRQLIVFAPITGEQRYLAVPAEFGPPSILYGAVLCAAGEQDHVHGHCHCSPFKVVLVSHRRDHQPQACVFSSETDTWSNIISTKYPCELHGDSVPATLIGNTLYWLLSCNAIFWFDLDMQSLAVIMGPPGMNESGNYRIIKPEDGADGLAIAIFLFPNLQIWQRVINSQGIATWFLRKTVEMHSTLGIPHQTRRKVWQDKVLGYDEDNDVIILYVDDSAYMLELKQMQSRKLNGTRSMKQCHPFTSFYPPDRILDICWCPWLAVYTGTSLIRTRSWSCVSFQLLGLTGDPAVRSRWPGSALPSRSWLVWVYGHLHIPFLRSRFRPMPDFLFSDLCSDGLGLHPCFLCGQRRPAGAVPFLEALPWPLSMALF